MKGGKPIASGSYGCVFKPALLCQGDTERAPGTVTKLMNIQNFKDEEEEIKKIAPYLAKIPNNQKYFVVTQIKKCVPQGYTQEDLTDFNKVCRPLLKGINGSYMTNASYIEKDTQKGYFVGLNLPDGGMDLFDYLINSNPSKQDLVKFLQSYSELIQHGIRPMNIVGVFHLDVKAENMVYKPDTNEVKLIDWGYAEYLPEKAPAPVFNRTLMQNRPFTNVLFYNRPDKNPVLKFFRVFLLNDGNRKAGTPISAILKQQGITTKERKRIIIDKLANELRTSIFFNKSSIVNYFGSQRALGHYNYIVTDYFGGLPAKMLSTISLQIASVLVEFSYNEKRNHFVDFDINRFYHTVFKYNVDIYGALTVLNKLPVSYTEVSNILQQLLFSDEYATKAYVIDDILAQVSYLSNLILPAPVAPAAAAPASRAHPVQVVTALSKGIRQTILGGKTQKKKKKRSRKPHNSKKAKKKKERSTRKKAKRKRK